MKVSTVCERLRELIEAAQIDHMEKDNLNSFVAALAKFDRMDVEAAIKMFQLLPLKRSAPIPPKVVETSEAAELKDLIFDDPRFEQALDRVAANKKLTKAALLGIYVNLFGSLTGVPSKSTRDELLDLIRRERIIVARNAKSRKA